MQKLQSVLMQRMVKLSSAAEKTKIIEKELNLLNIN